MKLRPFLITLLTTTLANPLLADECTLTMAYQNGFLHLDAPNNPQTSQSFAFNHFVMDTSASLFRRHVDEVVGELASEITFDEETRTVQIALDQTCKWSDGVPVTSADFEASLKSIFNAENDIWVPGRNIFKNGDAVFNGEMAFSELGFNILDDFHFEIELGAALDVAKAVLTYSAYAPMPSHKLKDNPNYWDQYPSSDIVFSGPYQITDIVDNKIVMNRNPHFCEGTTAAFDVVNIYDGMKYNEQANLFLEGDIDILGRIPARVMKMLDSHPDFEDNFKKMEVNDEVLAYFSVNPTDKRWQGDLLETLVSAIDEEFLRDPRDDFFLEPADSLSFRYPGYDPEPLAWASGNYAERVSAARARMEEMGYTDETPLKLDIISVEYDVYVYFAHALESMLSQLPVEVYLVIREPNAAPNWMEKQAQNTDADHVALVIRPWGSDYADPENFLQAMLKSVKADYPPAIRAKALIDEANAQNDPAIRMDLLEEAEYAIRDGNIAFPLVWINTAWMMKEELTRNENFFFLGQSLYTDECPQGE